MNRHVAFKVLASVGALAAAGCSLMPKVGPDYEEPEFEMRESALPDAGLPTTNLTEVGEYRPAEGSDDVRLALTTNDVANWWTP